MGIASIRHGSFMDLEDLLVDDASDCAAPGLPEQRAPQGTLPLGPGAARLAPGDTLSPSTLAPMAMAAYRDLVLDAPVDLPLEPPFSQKTVRLVGAALLGMFALVAGTQAGSAARAADAPSAKLRNDVVNCMAVGASAAVKAADRMHATSVANAEAEAAAATARKKLAAKPAARVVQWVPRRH
jgi:hypothetical protein